MFIDGTKLESKANRYNFMRKKIVERQLTLLRQKAKEMLALEQGNLTRNKLGGEIQRLNAEISEQGISVPRVRGHRKHNRSFKRFLTGGSCKVASELHFLALSQNIARYLSKCNKGALDCHLCTPKTLLKS